MTEQGYDLLVRAAPCHVESVRRNILDLVPAEDFAAVGRVFDRVSDAADRRATPRPTSGPALTPASRGCVSRG